MATARLLIYHAHDRSADPSENGANRSYRLLGRRVFTSMMENLGRTYAFAMCDVDHFKKFNDTYGHDVGDEVLKMVAAKLSHVDGGGRVFRYGGEEFLVVFRGRSALEAQPFMDAVRQAIAETSFVVRREDRHTRSRRDRAADQRRPTVTVTISIGVADKWIRHSTPELVLDAADAALYAAKAAGRNCADSGVLSRSRCCPSTWRRTRPSGPNRGSCAADQQLIRDVVRRHRLSSTWQTPAACEHCENSVTAC